MDAIKLVKLVKQYRNGTRALDELNLTVKKGEIFTLLGPNGAGKTTLINILTTCLNPTSGSATMLGKDLRQEAQFIRSQIACVAQQISIDTHLSLLENMIFQSRLYRVDAQTAQTRINTLIGCFGLEQYLKYPVAGYSGGVKRRLDMALSLVSEPKILFLDEPTVGMDIQSRQAMWDMMGQIRDEFGTTIFLTTHYLEEADKLSDTIGIMKEGRMIAQGTPGSLRQYIRQNMLRIGFDSVAKAKNCAAILEKNSPVKSFLLRETTIFVKNGDDRTDFTTLNRWLLEQKMDFTALEIVRPSLEDIFLSLTKPGKKEGN